MTAQFKDINVVITGATGVIGSTFVKALVEKGANVGILGRSEEKIVDLQNEIDKERTQTVALVANVLDKSSLQQAKQTFNEKFQCLLMAQVVIIQMLQRMMKCMMKTVTKHSSI